MCRLCGVRTSAVSRRRVVSLVTFVCALLLWCYCQVQELFGQFIRISVAEIKAHSATTCPDVLPLVPQNVVLSCRQLLILNFSVSSGLELSKSLKHCRLITCLI